MSGSSSGSSRRAEVDLARIEAAAAAIAGAVVRTPVAFSRTLSDITGASVWVKFENLQFTASFKERGALNKLLAVAAAGERSVVTASAGNFAQAVAFHAGRLGLTSKIVMPVGTPSVKVERTRALGASVVLLGDGFAAADVTARSLAGGDAVYLSPFDDPDVVAGQGTIALELLADVADLDAIVVPVGGGGLLAGMAVVARALRPDVELIGVQSERFASVAGGFVAGGGSVAVSGGPTIAEGIAVAVPGELTGRLIRELADDVVTVPEAWIEEAVCLYLEVEKTVTEGAGAVGLAALLEYPDRFRGRRVGLVLSGGNIDLLLLASVITRGMVRSRRLLSLTVELADRPGSLAAVSDLLASGGANILDVTHERHRLDLNSRLASVTFSVEARGAEHAAALVAELEAAGYAAVIDTRLDHSPS